MGVVIGLRLVLAWGIARAINAQLNGRAVWGDLQLSWGAARLVAVQIDDAAGEPVLTCPELRISWSLSGLLHHRSLAGAIAEVVVEAPRLNVALGADGRLNLAALYRPPPSLRAVDPTRMFQGRVHVRDGEVSYRDARTAYAATFRRLEGALDMTTLERCRGRLTFEQEALAAAGAPAARWRIGAAWKRDLADLRVTCRGEAIDVAGWAGYGLAKAGSAVPPAARGRVLSGRGGLDLLLSTAGPLASWRDTLHLSGTVSIDDLAVRLDHPPLTVQGGRLRATLTRDMIDIRQLALRVGGDSIEIAGRLFDRRRPQVDLEVRVRAPSVAQTLRTLGVRPPRAVEGRAAMRLQMLGAWSSPPRVSAVVTSPRLRVAGRLLRDVVGRFTWSSGVWRVERAALRSSTGRLEAEGWVFGDGRRRVVLDVRTRDARLADLVGQLMGVRARASADLTVVGSEQDPIVVGRGCIQDAVVGGVAVTAASARFVCHKPALLFSDAQASTALGCFRAPAGFVDLTGTRELFASITGHGITHRLDRGEVRDASVSLVVAGRPKHMYAAGRVEATAVSAGGLTLRNVEALVAMSPQLLWLRNAAFSIGRERVNARGSFSLADRTFEGSAWSASLDLGPMLAQLPRAAAGLAAGRGPLALEVAGTPQSAAFHLGRGGIRPVEVGGLWNGRSVLGAACAQGIDAGALRGLGLARWYPRGALDALLLFALRPGRFDLDIAGVSRTLRVAGVPFDRVSFSASSSGGAIDVREASLSGSAAVVALHGRIPTRDSGAWKLEWGADLRDLRTIVDRLEVGVSPARVQRVLAHMRLRGLSGHAFVCGSVGGARRTPDVDGTLLVDRASLHGDAATAQGRFHATAREVVLAPSRVTLGGDIVEVEGRVDVSAIPRLALRVATPQLALHRALGFTPYARVDAAGWMDGDVRITGRTDRPIVAGRVGLSHGRVGSQLLDDVEMTMRGGKDSVIVEQMLARVGTGTVRGSGTLRLNGPLDLRLSAQDFPLRAIAPLKGGLWREARGDIDLHVGGTSARPAVDASFRARGMEVDGGGKSVSARGRVRWTAPRLELDALTLSLEGRRGSVQVEGALDFLKQTLPARFDDFLASRGSMAVTFQDASIETMLELAGQSERDASGLLRGSVRLSGAMKRPAVAGDLEAVELRLGGVDVGTLQGSAAFDLAGMQMDRLDLSTQGAAGALRVSGGGAISDAHLTVQASDLEVGALRPFLPWRFPFSGRLTASFDASGPLFNPRLSGRIALMDGRLSTVAFDSFTGSVSGSEGIYRLEDFVWRKGPHRATLHGTLPLRFERGVFTSPVPIDIKASLTEESLDVLSLFVPDMLDSPGRIRAALSVTGTVADVQWDGELTVRGGTIRHRNLGQPIENVEANVTLKERRLQIRDTAGRLGRGAFTIAGSADVSGVSLSDMNIRLNGKDLDVVALPYLAALVDVDLHLIGSTASPYVTGRVNTRSARVSLPIRGLGSLSSGASTRSSPAAVSGRERAIEAVREAERVAPRPAAEADDDEEEAPAGRRAPFSLPSLTLSVELNLGSDAWLRFLGSAVRAEGQLSLVGKGADAAPAGEIALKQGQIQIPFFPVTMRLSSGRAYFSPSNGWMPYLDATATAQVGQNEIYVDVKGKANNPDLRLSSNPPMPPAAIRLLLLGGTAAQSDLFGPGGYTQNTSLGVSALVSVAQATFLRPVTSFFGRLFGMSEVTVELLNQDSVQITVYKALGLKQKLQVFFSSLQGTLLQAFPRQLYGFEYRFTPAHLVRISSDNLGALHLFYQARWRF